MRKLHLKTRHAFTMIELVFVIVVMGILAKFGVDLFLQIYEGYTRTTIGASLLSKTEAAVGQIANRLTYRIKDSVIATDAAGGFGPLVSANGTEKIFEWVGLDHNGWDDGDYSGIIDLDLSTKTLLASPGTSALPVNGALLFAGSKIDVANSFGWYGSYDENTSDLHIYDGVAAGGGAISFATNSFKTGDEIFEFYQVASSAFALELDTTDASNKKLLLYQNYYPWLDGVYTDVTPDLLVDHVSTFTLQKSGDIIKIELCLSNANFMGEGEYSICKTKIVF
ncbi:type II secretion system protein [Thiomicrolovo sp. ZZH C-3]